MARCVVSAVISFGLVAIPVKLYKAAESEAVSFNMITPGGNRVKQHYTDSITNEAVTHADCQKGYEIAKDEFVIFTKDEMKSLETKSDGSMQITEFVDAGALDPVAVEKTYYLGPDKGGDRGYTLLAETMKALGKVAVAQWAMRGKDQLVMVRPYKGGLLLHVMFHAGEIRPFDEIKAATTTISDAEHGMAAKLVMALTSSEYDPSKYEDGFTKRVKVAAEAKKAGTFKAESGQAKPKAATDLLAALMASLGESKTA